MGSYVVDTNEVKKHFDILNHSEYYNLGLSIEDITIIYNKYRNLLSHNSVLAPEAVLAIGSINDLIYEKRNGSPYLNLVPLLDKTRDVLLKFLSNSDSIVSGNKQLHAILKK